MSMFLNTKNYQSKLNKSNNSESDTKLKYIITSNKMAPVSMKNFYNNFPTMQNSDLDSDSEKKDSSYDSDEYDYPVKCTCGWRCEYPESHVDHSKMFGCDYIQWKYDLSYDEDGDLIAKPKKIQTVEKKPTKKNKPVQQKQSKDGCFNICGISRRVKCDDACCRVNFFSCYVDDDIRLATILSVKFADKDIVKAKGAIWSSYEKVWFVRASNKNYKELCEKF